MSLNFRESFQVLVPPERAWQFVTNPGRVALCLPGAELTETVDATTYRGRVKIKLGPISTAYDGTATLTEVNDATRTMRMVGEGRELGSAGSARMKMVGTVTPHPDGGSLIEVDATIDIAGRIMQFGRGLIESFSRQLFKEFADAVRQTLERSDGPATESVAASGAAPAATPAATAAADIAVSAHTAPTQAVASLQQNPDRSTPAAAPQPRELRVLPMLWRAVVDWLRHLLGGASRS